MRAFLPVVLCAYAAPVLAQTAPNPDARLIMSLAVASECARSNDRAELLDLAAAAFRQHLIDTGRADKAAQIDEIVRLISEKKSGQPANVVVTAKLCDELQARLSGN